MQVIGRPLYCLLLFYATVDTDNYRCQRIQSLSGKSKINRKRSAHGRAAPAIQEQGVDFMSVDSEEQEAGSEKTSPFDIVGKSPKPHPKQSFGE